MDENTVNLMDKNLNDLTVGDAVKINLVVIAATVAIPVAILAVSSAVSSVKNKLHARKTKSLTVVTPTESEK